MPASGMDLSHTDLLPLQLEEVQVPGSAPGQRVAVAVRTDAGSSFTTKPCRAALSIEPALLFVSCAQPTDQKKHIAPLSFPPSASHHHAHSPALPFPSFALGAFNIFPVMTLRHLRPPILARETRAAQQHPICCSRRTCSISDLSSVSIHPSALAGVSSTYFSNGLSWQ